ncbi:hypothetical protein RCL1_007834 [Eukaryota sp. TZLM3-RCL]
MYLTNETFLDNLPLIESSIADADFVSLDFEFSDSSDRNAFKNPLSTVEERFNQELRALQPVSVFQFGLSCAKFTSESDVSLQTFHFYTYPKYVKELNNEQLLPLSNSTLQFLTNNGLNLQQWYQDGVSYLTPEQETAIRSTLVSNVRQERTERRALVLHNEEAKNFVSNLDNQLLEFSKNSEESITFSDTSKSQRFFIYHRINSNYPTYRGVTENNSLIVFKFNEEEAKEYDNSRQNSRENQIKSLIGARLIFDLLKKYEKTLVCHGGLTDLLIIPIVFYGYTPSSLKDFKSFLSSNFNSIYDTALIVTKNRLSNFLRLSEVFRTLVASNIKLNFSTRENEAEEMKEFLSNCSQESPIFNLNCHNAGFDSMITSIVFSYLKRDQSNLIGFKNQLYLYKTIGSLFTDKEDYNPCIKTNVFALRNVTGESQSKMIDCICTEFGVSSCDVMLSNFLKMDYVVSFSNNVPSFVLKSIKKAAIEKKVLINNVHLDTPDCLIVAESAGKKRRQGGLSEEKSSSCILM